ncbi:C39 family peptidase [Candidatus Nephthysia bennettiae]|uniref:C39 family peptidase n=1 Tax=Candidatus Nephthysia bennettiae TaxID=3127016 RepID=A0A934N5J8_9BACT|nr:C39 family peptidase [Candidatus Dormibacteraeota bacterium]MBJ7611937.1 C39 family peptidase [Candidatus Dormibacteraeota bacterium]
MEITPAATNATRSIQMRSASSSAGTPLSARAPPSARASVAPASNARRDRRGTTGNAPPARGTAVSQDWILTTIGADTRGAVTDVYGDVLDWGDPYESFVGDVMGSELGATGYGVYHGPIAAAARAAGHSATGGQGWSAADMYAAVSAGYPVVIWTDASFTRVAARAWTAWDGRSR